jgi:hypothetical protein
MGPQVTRPPSGGFRSSLRRAALLALHLALLPVACLERPDPASQAAAILNKRPAGFQDRLIALDALASAELGIPGRPALAESLHALAARLRPALAGAFPGGAPGTGSAGDGGFDSLRAGILDAFLFDTLGLVPLLDDTTLASSLPSRVLADRRGGCLGLSLLYLALAEALGLPLRPVFLPGHVMVRWRSPSLVRNVETLRRGLARGDGFYRETFSLARRPWYALADARPDQALAALVFNLANLHRAREMLAAAEAEYRLAESFLPAWPEALGNLGATLMLAGDRDGAREYLEAALAGDSLAAPALRNLETLGRAP